MKPIPKNTTLDIDLILGLIAKAGKESLNMKTLVHNILQKMEDSGHNLIHVYSDGALGECYVYSGVIPMDSIVRIINLEILDFI
jgi:hypothetical protein